MPNLITCGGVAAGAAGFADSYFNLYRGVDLGIRDFLPEPIDIPDHGMSWAMGATLAQVHFSKLHGKRLSRRSRKGP